MAAQAQWHLSGDYFEVDSTGNRLRRATLPLAQRPRLN